MCGTLCVKCGGFYGKMLGFGEVPICDECKVRMMEDGYTEGARKAVAEILDRQRDDVVQTYRSLEMERDRARDAEFARAQECGRLREKIIKLEHELSILRNKPPERVLMIAEASLAHYRPGALTWSTVKKMPTGPRIFLECGHNRPVAALARALGAEPEELRGLLKAGDKVVCYACSDIEWGATQILDEEEWWKR